MKNKTKEELAELLKSIISAVNNGASTVEEEAEYLITKFIKHLKQGGLKMENKKVVINIKQPDTFTKDLYSSIQGKKGKIVKQSVYEPSKWLVGFGVAITKKYGNTHSGKVCGYDEVKHMFWWIDQSDFIVLN